MSEDVWRELETRVENVKSNVMGSMPKVELSGQDHGPSSQGERIVIRGTNGQIIRRTDSLKDRGLDQRTTAPLAGPDKIYN